MARGKRVKERPDESTNPLSISSAEHVKETEPADENREGIC